MATVRMSVRKGPFFKKFVEKKNKKKNITKNLPPPSFLFSFLTTINKNILLKNEKKKGGSSKGSILL
jgi:hypothetical protein